MMPWAFVLPHAWCCPLASYGKFTDLCWALSAAAREAGARAPSFPSAYFLAIANPKAYAALGAVYSGNTLITEGFGEQTLLMDSGAKLLVMVCVMITVNGSWLIFGSAFAAVLTDPRKSRIANICFAILLVGSVVLAVL